MKNTKIHKLILFILVLSQLMSIQVFALSTEFNTEKIELTKEQINLKIEEINSRYKIGEAFSKEDSEFIVKYTSINNTKSISNKDFDVTKSSSDGKVTANCKGYTTAELNIVNHKFGANYTTVITKGAAYVEKIENQVSCTAYGVVGSDGIIGKIYEKTLSSSTTSKTTWNFDESENFSGVVLTMFVNAKSIITYTDGSFSVN